MSFLYQSLNDLDTLQLGELQATHRLTMLTPEGLVNTTWGTAVSTITDPLVARIEALEAGEGGGTAPGSPSIWPTARTLTLAGAVTGSVSMDGSQNVSMTTSIADASLSIDKVSGLQAQLDAVGTASNNRWGTGYTSGPQPSSYGGNLNTLSGAVFVYSEPGTTNPPEATGGSFVVLQNGPNNYGQQIGLRAGEAWIRGQVAGAWGAWNKLWTSANLNPADLLLKTDVATSAQQLATPRSFSLTGTVTATAVNFNGTANVALNTTIADGALTIAKTTGLQTALNNRFEFRGALSTALNSVTISGYYQQTTSGSVTLANDYPVVGQVGTLRVVNLGSVITQEYMTEVNTYYRRVFTGGSWSLWQRTLVASEVDLSTKLDKTGGTITGDLVLNGSTGSGTLAVQNLVRASHFVTTRGDNGTTGNWALETYNGEAVTDNFRGGIFRNSERIALVHSRPGNFWRALSITSAGALNYEIGNTHHSVFHAGNFDPTNPVPVAGLLNIGDPGGANLRLRNDGRYSIDGGTTWRELNEAPGVVTNPHYASVTIGADTDILLYEDSTPGTFIIRSGSSSAYRFFNFHANGNFAVPNGRVLIEGNEAWHAGNFNPATKLDAGANAVSATRLVTARTINGVAFDGTQNITISTSLGDSPTITGSTWFDVNNSSTGMGVIRANGATGITLDAVNATNSAYAPLNLTGSAVTINNNTAWHAGNFNPASKLDGRPELSTTAHLISDWNLATTNGWYMAAGATNAPAGAGGNWLMGRVTQHNPNWIQQEVWVFTFGAETVRYRRHMANGTWGAWTTRMEFGEVSATPGSSPSAYHAQLPADTQMGAFAIQWNGYRQWQLGIENNGTFKIWGYSATGVLTSEAMAITRAGYISTGNGMTIGGAARINGAARAVGSGASMEFEDRGDATKLWGIYSTANQLKIWHSDSGDVVRINPDGSLHPQRVAAGWDSGTAGAISCNNWFRTTGQTGIYFSDYGGGVHMQDSTFVRTYNGKAMAASFFETYSTNWTPQANAQQAAYRASGSYGGGFGMVDGSYHMSIFSSNGDMRFGFGTNTISSHPAGINKDGTVLAADFYLTSDGRLKEELGPLEFKGRLRPVHFRWLESGKEDFGFIAQDVQALYPDAVRVDDHTGTLKLTQGKLTAVLAVQVNQVEDDVVALRTEVADLRFQLDELRQMLQDMRNQ